MKVGIIIDFDLKPTEGGGHSYITMFLNQLLSSKTNHQFVLLSPNSNIDLAKAYSIPSNVKVEKLVADNFKITKIGFIKILGRLLRFFKVFSKALSLLEDKQQGLYCESFKERGIHSLIYLPYNKIYTLDIPYFYIIWDIGHRNINVFPEVSSNGKFAYRETLFNKVIQRAYKVIAETESGKADIEKYYSVKAENIVVAPLFAGSVVHESSTTEGALAYLKKNDLKQYRYLFYPAQFWAHKNHINLLVAFKELKASYSDLRLVFCGEDKGNLSHITSYIKQNNLSDNVVMLGFVKELKELKFLYENALALIMPTFLGPSNMPILEAMALNCPVICSDFEGHRELGGDCLLYVSPTDPSSMVGAVQSLMDDEDFRIKMATNAKLKYESSIHHVEVAISKVLHELDKFEPIRRCWS